MNFPTDPVWHWLARTTCEGAGLIALVLALRWALGTRLTPGWRIALWAVVGLKLLVPATLPLGFGFGAVQTRGVATATSVAPVPSGPVVSEASPALVPVEKVAPPSRLVPAWGCLWMSGALGVAVALFRRESRFRRSLAGFAECDDRELLALVRECGAPVNPRILLTTGACGPAVAGLFSPVLLLPADWRERFDRASLRHILCHEIEHLRSRDLLWNWIAALIAAVHWFNPLVWLAASRFQADRELRCDARALERLAPAERVAYGRTLLRLAEHFLAPPAIAGLAPCVRNHPTLRHRITMITHPTRNTPALQALLAGAVGLVVCLSFGSARAQEEPGKDRSREGERARESGEKAPAAREGERRQEGERPRDGERPREGEKMRDGERVRSAERDSERPKSAERDGERPKSAERDGERPRTGERDGERPRSGERDGDRPREGLRDGERPREGARDGEGRRMREGEGARESDRAGGPPIEIRVLGAGDEVRVGSDTVPVNRLRGFLKDYLAEQKGRPVVIDAEPATPYSAVAGVLDAVRDNGAKNAQIRPAAGR